MWRGWLGGRCKCSIQTMFLAIVCRLLAEARRTRSVLYSTESLDARKRSCGAVQDGSFSRPEPRLVQA